MVSVNLTKVVDNSTAIRYNIIVAYEKMEDWESAEVKLEEYLESYPNDKAAKKEAEFLETR